MIPSAIRKRAEETFIKVVESIRCPDYGEHRETESYAEFRKENIERLETFGLEVAREAREEALREIMEICNAKLLPKS